MSRNSANGSTREWRKLRAAKLAVDSKCQWFDARRRRRCGQPATDVDHIHPLATGGSRFDWDNLRSLCADHHKLRHGKRPKPTVDPKTGLPTDNHWWAE